MWISGTTDIRQLRHNCCAKCVSQTHRAVYKTRIKTIIPLTKVTHLRDTCVDINNRANKLVPHKNAMYRQRECNELDFIERKTVGETGRETQTWRRRILVGWF